MNVSRDFSTRPRRNGWGRLEVPALGLAALVALAGGASAWHAGADARRAALELEGARAELDEMRERERSLEPVDRRADETLVSRILLSREAPPHRVVAELAALLPADARFAELRLDYGARLELDARVRARGPEAYDRLLERLGSSPHFQDVEPGSESREAELTAAVRLAYRQAANP